jgi:hypothetical protein
MSRKIFVCASYQPTGRNLDLEHLSGKEDPTSSYATACIAFEVFSAINNLIT